MGCLYTSRYNTFLDCASRRRPVYPKVVITFLHNASRRTRRAMHASCESPWHSLAKHCILDTCFLLTVPFRGMLLTPQGGPRCLAPTAHQIPVYLMVFSTFLCRAFTAHHPQHITLTALAQVVTQPRVATQLVIAGDPAVRSG